MLALFDPQTDKSLETFGVTVGGVAAAIYYIRELFRRHVPKPPNEQLDAAHQAMSARVQKAEDEITDLWNTMRKEDSDTRNQLTKAISDFERAVGKLEGTIGQVGKVMDAILEQQLNR